jgi:hypothetical protein
VKQPVGSQSVFLPSFLAADPTFEVNVAGIYEFQLDVWDQNDQKSLTSAFVTVAVIPDEVIHVELLWTTEGDPDQTDAGPEAGVDLDLHFAHPFAIYGPDVDGDGAPDPWFDVPFDCFWFNAHPNWGSLNPAVDDNPGLDRDDTDGAGPENINLNLPAGRHGLPCRRPLLERPQLRAVPRHGARVRLRRAALRGQGRRAEGQGSLGGPVD